MILVLVLLLTTAMAACDRGAPPDSEQGASSVDSEAPALALYRRELSFLAEEGGRPAATVSAQVRPLGNRALRSVQAWMTTDAGWTVLALDRWEAAPLRQPWRVLPHGPLRLLVEDGGDLEALVFGREASSPRLESGPLAGEWNAGADARVLLRGAELRVGATATPGVLVDVELGSMTLPDTVLGTRAVLTDGEGGIVVLVMLPEEGLHALAFRGAQAEVLPLQAVVPEGSTRWRLLSAEEEVLGELSPRDERAEEPVAQGAEPADAAALAGRPPLQVTGWIRLGGDRRDLVGLFRPEGG